MADGSVLIDTKLDPTGLKSGLDSLSGIVNKSNLAKAGSTILKGITAISGALTAAGTFAVKTGMDFDTSMSQVMATLGLTGEEAENAYAVMSAAAKEAGETTQYSAKQSADALNYLALAGYKADQAANVLPSVLNLAAAGAMDLAYASDLATDAMSALGIEATGENLDHFGDQLAKTASRSNTSVAQLGEAILTVGGNAKQLAGGTDELNTALGVLANRGIKGAEGGTHLRNIILSLTAPTSTATKAIKKLGLQTTDAAGNLRPLDDIMADFNKKTEKMSAAAKMNYMNKIFNKTDLAAVQALLAGTGEEWDNLEQEIRDCDGAMKQMADTQLDNLAGDVTIFKSALEGLGIAAYEGVAEPLRDIVKLGTEMIGTLTTAMKKGGFEGLAGAIGDVLAQCITEISKYIPKIVSMAVKVIKSFVQGIKKNAKTISTAFVEALSSITEGVIDILPDIIDAGGELIINLAEGMAEKFPSLFQSLAKNLEKMAGQVTEIAPKMVSAAQTLVSSLIAGVATSLPSITQSFISGFMTIVTSINQIKTQFLYLGGEIVKALGTGLIEAIPTIVDALPDLLMSIVDFFITKYSVMITVGAQLFSKLAEALPEAINQIGEKLPEFINGIVERIGEFAEIIAEAGVTLFSALVENLPAIFEAVSSALMTVDWASVGKQLWDAICKGFAVFGDWIKELVLGEDYKPEESSWADVGSRLWEMIKSGIHAAGDWLKSLVLGEEFDPDTSTWGDVGARLWQLVKDGIHAGGDWIKSLVLGQDFDPDTSTWGDVGSRLWELIKAGIHAGGDWIKSLVLGSDFDPDTSTWADVGSRLWELIKSGITATGDWIKSLVLGSEYTPDSSWADVGKKIWETITTGIHAVGDWIKQLVLGKGYTPDASWADVGKSMWEKIKEGFSNVAAGMAEIATNIWNGLKDGLSNFWESAKETIMAPFTGVLDWIKNLFGIHSPSTEMESIGGFLLQGLGNGLTAGLEAILETVSRVFNAIWDAIKSIFGFGKGESEESKEAKQAGKDIMSGMKEGIEGNEEDMKTAVKNAGKNALSTLRTELGVPENGGSSTKTKPMGQGIVQGVQDGIDDKATSSNLSSQGTKLYNAVKDAFNTALGTSGNGSGSSSQMKNHGTGIVQGVVDGIKDKGKQGTFSDAVNTTKQAIIDAFNSALGIPSGSNPAEQLKPAGEGTVSGIVEGISNKAESSTFAGSADKTRNAIRDAFKSSLGISGWGTGSASEFEAIGQAICEGIKKGIEGNSSLITSAAKAAAKSAYTSAKKELGIHSPSKVFAELGRYCGLGMAEGLEDSESDVVKTVRALAEAMTDTDLVKQMQGAMDYRTQNMASAITDAAGRLEVSNSSDGTVIDYEELAGAIWENAPDMNIYMNAEKVGRQLEPTISERQAQKARNKVRRGNIEDV